MHNPPYFTDDTIVFGILMILVGFVFYTSAKEEGFWKKFYNVVPALLLCYLLPSIFSSLHIIADKWTEVNEAGRVIENESHIYFVASRYLLPAALVLMTLSIDLKALLNLGPKALIVFLAGTLGIILGGPIAILIVSIFSPETVGGAGFDAVWRGLSTLAGSWIGGGANQAAMLEIFKFNQQKYGGMVLVDIVVANIGMAALLYGIGKKEIINKWLKANNSSIQELQDKVSSYQESVKRNPTLTDYMIIAAIAFGAVGFSHWGSQVLADFFTNNFETVRDPKSFASTFGGSFFWMITLATIIGISLSFTPLKSYEGAGASKIGSIFIYILVASIGMKMDLTAVLDNPGLILVGVIWMLIHFIVIFLVAKIIKAPYFFIAVGSQANVGGAASAPVVASAFHPSLASVGVLLAIFGYIVGTYGAILCAYLMEIVAPK
ncbi:MAG: DUF819 family protein [Flavobacterium sp.]|nr:DUF819 family protein [Flavobacterium sp.]